MTDPTHPAVKLSDPVSLTLHAAKLRLRKARVLAEEQGDATESRARITMALDLVQDELDHRDQS